MRVSQLGLSLNKLSNLDKQFPVQDVLVQTGQLKQFASGIYGYDHIPFLVKNQIKNIISEILAKYGCIEINLPVLQPESLWKRSGRLERYVEDKVMFRSITEKGNYCLAPTAEEAVVEFVSDRLQSYKQLPVTYFQTGEKFRDELRSRGFLLRGKSFEMTDAYSFGKDQEDLNSEYERIKMAFSEIFERVGLPSYTVTADNGDMGGSKSEEFMFFSEIGEDKILFDEKTEVALNAELLERENALEYLKNNYGVESLDGLIERRAAELGHIFQLGDKYSKSMDVTYIDESGKRQNFMMGCYGIGVSRVLALVYENSIVKNSKGEFEGIALPINLSPYMVYMIPKIEDSEKSEITETVYNDLIARGVPVLLDDRIGVSIGAKIKDAKVLGIPYISVFGKTLDEGNVEIENMATSEKSLIAVENYVEIISESFLYKESNVAIEDVIKKNDFKTPKSKKR